MHFTEHSFHLAHKTGTDVDLEVTTGTPPLPPTDVVAAMTVDEHSTTALYAITGWYGGLYVDLTVDTGDQLVEPDILRAVIQLAETLGETE